MKSCGIWILVIGICLGFGIWDLGFAQNGQMHHMEGMSPEEHAKMMAKPAEVAVSAERQSLVGIKTEVVRRRTLKKNVRTVGTVAYDPELYEAQTEYAQAVEGGDEELIASARLKLERMGLSAAMIERIKKSDESLIVGSKGSVWIYGKIYEQEISLVKPGMTVHVTAKSLPGEMFMGKISSVDRVLDEVTRSLKVRAQVANRSGHLKPNLYVDILIEAPLGEKIAVPEDAIMDTGEKQIIYVQKGPGKFEPRVVAAGQRSEGMVEILKGLSVGETIVTSGTFLIDSETKLKSTGGGHQH